MQFSISASGTPAEIRTQLQQQAQSARREDSDSATITGAISDYVARTLDGMGVDESITVRGSVELTITGSQATMQAIADRKTATASNPLAPARQIPSPHAAPAATSSERPDVAAAEAALQIPPAIGTPATAVQQRRAADQPSAQPMNASQEQPK